MRIRKPLLTMLCCLSVAAGTASVHAAEPTVTALIIPARYTIVQLAFDIAHMDDTVTLVSYEQANDIAQPALHIWDAQAGDWLRIAVDELQSGQVFRTLPKHALVIGNELDQMTILEDAVGAWCPDVLRIESMNIAEIVNQADSRLDFTPYEWKWLAMRYQLQIEDLNADRRRYGRYGKPGGAKNDESRPSQPPSDQADLRTTVPVEESAQGEMVETAVEPEGAAPIEEDTRQTETGPDPADK
jgi:hypothetical protein